MAPMSNAPSNAIEGGDFPRGDLLVTEARFGVHKYMKKGLGQNADGTDVMTQVMARNGSPAIAVVAYITLRNDEGTEFPQFYSVGDPARYTIAKDGSEIEKGDLKTNCNYYQLLKALVNAGYPEDKLREESKIAPLFVGMYAKWDQETEKRGDSSQLVLPLELHQFPWGPAVQGAPVAPAVEGGEAQTITVGDTAVMETSPQAADDESVIAKVVEAANAMLDDPETKGARKRDDLSMFIFNTRDKDEKMEMMGAVMNAATAEALTEAGITLDGEELSK
jgi:hypothetical protein